MSHEIYNYGEGLIGKVAAAHSHKWIFKEQHPRAWEAQFQSGIQTIALVAVKEGVVQLGSMNKVTEDLSYVVLLRKKFSYLHSIPGVLLPHPSSSSFPLSAETNVFHDFSSQQVNITPSVSSLEALLSKFPSMGSLPTMNVQGNYNPTMFSSPHRPMEFMMDTGRIAKVEMDEDKVGGHDREMNFIGESSSSMSSYILTNVTKSNNEF
ncbi:Transcription factor [Acorus gramineus]|uniref:Transcription factor n=1 Tax=Acorus gramineus TaxID=55184 RepID=A0AAV9ACB6_ACOGR|nr:Transcription factor [Acorus gramineus]